MWSWYPREALRSYACVSERHPAPTYLVTMVPAARWLVVALVALAVCAPPTVLRLLPASDSDSTAVALAEMAARSTDVAWSGEVRSRGSLALPLDGSSFGGIARLLGEQTHLRVWWRDPEHWRIDRIRTTGESDQLRTPGTTIRWNYEEGTVRFVSYSPIREPDDSDIVPSTLAVRMLAGAQASELGRLPSRRLAGHSAAGVRLTPSHPMSTIGRVDVWTEESSGVPLRVDVYGAGDLTRPALSSEVVRLDADPPTDREVGFEASPTADFQRAPSLDSVASANAFAPFVLPSRLMDLERRGATTGLGAVGVYGRGPTTLLAVPLRDPVARELHQQLASSRRARETAGSVAVEVGPLSVLLAESGWGNFLLTGTITPEALQQAAIEIRRTAVRTP